MPGSAVRFAVAIVFDLVVAAGGPSYREAKGGILRTADTRSSS
jgi:hypothetical protein